MGASGTELFVGTAVSVALLHTLVGVDHYLPFVVLARARGWSSMRTLAITVLCGLAHVGASIALGLVGIAFGLGLDRLAWIQSIRGSLAGWGLIAFGLAYVAWALWSSRSHHAIEHGSARHLTFWSLFVVFALGPCEPLVPLLMAPAWRGDWWGVVAVGGVFAAVTIGTMTIAVFVCQLGLRWPALKALVAGRAERHGHALAGLAISLSGVLIVFFDM